jgi:hypothetical protein
LGELIKEIISNPPDLPIYVYYMFYDDPTLIKKGEDSDNMVKNLPYEMMY